MNATLESVENRSALRFERRSDHSVERVWRAITEPEDLRHWFPGRTWRSLRASRRAFLTGSWHGDAPRLELRAEGEGCVLVFTHAFAEREKAPRDAAGWESCFARLDALLAGEPMSETDSRRRWPEIHERYAERFGLDPALARKAFAEHNSQQ